MEKRDRGFKVIAVIALLIATVGLTIAYAGYTATLTIGGSTTATVTSNWRIIWSDLATSNKTGYAEFDTSASKLAIMEGSQTIRGVIGTMKAPGDSLKYTFNAKNEGDINATLNAISLGTLNCTPASVSSGETAATQEQATSLCGALTLEITYNGKTLTSADPLTDLDSTDKALPSANVKPVTLKIAYGTDASADPVAISGPVTVSLGATTFTYGQAAATN